jgi:hypothetical protein
MPAASVVALLLAALCVASAARIPDDDHSNIKETLSNVGSVQVGAADVLAVWLLLLLLFCQLQATCALAAGSSSLLLHDPATTCAAIIHCCYARGRRIKPDLVWEWSTAEHLCERIRYAQCAVIQDPLPQVLCCTASVLDLHVQHIVFALRECPCGGEIVLCLD